MKHLARSMAGSNCSYFGMFATMYGGLEAGVFLSMLMSWEGHQKDKEEGWIYKTRDDIAEETGMTRSNQETARRKLLKAGVLEEELRGVPARMFYRINWDALIDDIETVQAKQSRKSESGHPVGGNPSNWMAEIQPTSVILTETQTEEKDFADPTESADGTADSPPSKPKRERHKPSSEAERLFEEAWLAYPRRNGSRGAKVDARKTFLSILKERGPAEAASIMASIAEWKEKCEEWRNGFPKDMCRWLQKQYRTGERPWDELEAKDVDRPGFYKGQPNPKDPQKCLHWCIEPVTVEKWPLLEEAIRKYGGHVVQQAWGWMGEDDPYVRWDATPETIEKAIQRELKRG